MKRYDPMMVGKRIRRQRIIMGLTQEEVAEKIERSYKYYHQKCKMKKALLFFYGLSHFRVYAKGRIRLLLINISVLNSPCFKSPVIEIEPFL